MSEPRIYSRHARQAGNGRGLTCAPGIRGWCAANNIDVRAFVRDGIAGEEALRIGGHFALSALANARKEAANG